MPKDGGGPAVNPFAPAPDELAKRAATDAMMRLMEKVGSRKPIVLLDDARGSNLASKSQTLRSRRRSTTASTGGFQELISKVNITYDMNKIVPSTTGATLNLTSSKHSLNTSKQSLGKQSADSGDGDDNYIAPTPAPTSFMRRVSHGAMELLKGFSNRSSVSMESGDRLSNSSRPASATATNSRQNSKIGGGPLNIMRMASMSKKSIRDSQDIEEGDEEAAENSTHTADANLSMKSVPRFNIVVNEEDEDEEEKEAAPHLSVQIEESGSSPSFLALGPAPDRGTSSEFLGSSGGGPERQSSFVLPRSDWHLEAAQSAKDAETKAASSVETRDVDTIAPLPRKKSLGAESLRSDGSSSAIEINQSPFANPTAAQGARRQSLGVPGMAPAVAPPPSGTGRRQSLSVPGKSPVPLADVYQPVSIAVGSGAGAGEPEGELKPSRSITTLTVGGFIATTDTSPLPARSRRGSAIGMMPPSIVIPKSPSRSDLIKVQSFQTPSRTSPSGAGMFAIPSSPATSHGMTINQRLDRAADIGEEDSSTRPSLATSPGQMKIPKSPTMPRNNSTASRYIEILANLRAKAAPQAGTLENSKIKSFQKVVQIAADLKKVGEDASLATELDPASLQMVIGLKKWARAMRQKKNSDLKQSEVVKEMTHRMMTELPRPLHLDLINDALPIVESYYASYKLQLGEKHSFVGGCRTHLEKLKGMLKDKGITLADMPTEEEEAAAANAMQQNLKNRIRSLENLQNSKSSLNKEKDATLESEGKFNAGENAKNQVPGRKQTKKKVQLAEPETGRHSLTQRGGGDGVARERMVTIDVLPESDGSNDHSLQP